MIQDRGTLSALTLATRLFMQRSSTTIVAPYLRSPQRTCDVCADTSFTAKACCRFPIPCESAENADGEVLPVSFGNCLSNSAHAAGPGGHDLNMDFTSRRAGLSPFQKERPNRAPREQQSRALTERLAIYSPGFSPSATWRLKISTCDERCGFDAGGRTDVSNRPHRISAARSRRLGNEGSPEIAAPE